MNRDMQTGRLVSSVDEATAHNICNYYHEGHSVAQLAIRFGLAGMTIRRVLRQGGCSFNSYRRLGEQEIAQLISDWDAGEESHILAKKYGISVWTVRRLANHNTTAPRRSGSRRLHSLDEDAFDVLMPAACYWAGFLMADGSVGRHAANRTSRTIALNLAEKDAAHVEAFRSFINSSAPITLSPPPPGTKASPQAKFAVRSGRMADRLESLGIIPNKSDGTTAHPILATSRDFWRGMVDGDGSVLLERWANDRPLLILNGCAGLLDQFASFLEPILGYRTTIHKGNGKSFAVRLSSGPAERVAHILYEDAVIALPRKAAAVEQIRGRREMLDAMKGSHPRRKTATVTLEADE